MTFVATLGIYGIASRNFILVSLRDRQWLWYRTIKFARWRHYAV